MRISGRRFSASPAFVETRRSRICGRSISLHRELFAEVGGDVAPGELGENVTTEGVDLLSLPRGNVLQLGADAVVEITGLRNPCRQIDRFQPGLLEQVIGTDADGRTVRKAGVMAIVVAGGVVEPGNPIEIALPPLPHEPLQPV